jgi:small GTP-binding protein
MNKKKVILTGSFGVGKTSLFNRFLYNQFSDKYLTTIGVKVDKKTVIIEGEEVTLMIWDIAGEISQDKVPNSYFLQSSAVIYVFDLTRPSTYGNMEFDLKYLNEKVPGGLIKVIGNKKDLISEEEVQKVMREVHQIPDIITSAKTGENVENLFFDLAKALTLGV